MTPEKFLIDNLKAGNNLKTAPRRPVPIFWYLPHLIGEQADMMQNYEKMDFQYTALPGKAWKIKVSARVFDNKATLLKYSQTQNIPLRYPPSTSRLSYSSMLVPVLKNKAKTYGISFPLPRRMPKKGEISLIETWQQSVIFKNKPAIRTFTRRLLIPFAKNKNAPRFGQYKTPANVSSEKVWQNTKQDLTSRLSWLEKERYISSANTYRFAPDSIVLPFSSIPPLYSINDSYMHTGYSGTNPDILSAINRQLAQLRGKNVRANSKYIFKILNNPKNDLLRLAIAAQANAHTSPDSPPEYDHNGQGSAMSVWEVPVKIQGKDKYFPAETIRIGISGTNIGRKNVFDFDEKSPKILLPE